MAEETLFPTSSDELLISVYQKQGRTLDDLPYTPEFDAICEAMGAGSKSQRADLFHRLHNLRKAAGLPRMGRSVEPRPRIDAAQEALLAELVEAAIGRLSLRDQLPYADAFDDLVTRFNARAGLSLHPRDVWRLVAKLAK